MSQMLKINKMILINNYCKSIKLIKFQIKMMMRKKMMKIVMKILIYFDLKKYICLIK